MVMRDIPYTFIFVNQFSPLFWDVMGDILLCSPCQAKKFLFKKQLVEYLGT